jgi:hypothetical protein
MRTYTSFILFEEVLDFTPQVDSTLYQFVQDVTNPRVRVLKNDCGTTVGRIIPVTYEIEGLTELSNDTIITKTRIDTLLSSGTYFVAVRDLYTCVVDQGVCQRCYEGTYIDMAVPETSATVRLVPEYNYQTDVFVSNGVQLIYTLTESPNDYEKVLVIIDGVILMSGYTITDLTLTMTVAPVFGKNIVVKYYKTTAQPFVGWLSLTYSGAVLGMKPLPTQPLHIRPSLAQSLYSDEELNIMQSQLGKYPLVPSDSLAYAGSIHDRLERALYISMLYGIYSNAI